MKNLLTLLFLSFFCSVNNVNAQQITPIKASVFYQGTYDNFLREARQQKKIAVISFFASWSAPAKKMDNETFSNPQFTTYVHDKFMVYRVDADTFGGMEIVNRFAVDTFPSVVLVDEHTRLLGKWTGFQTATQLIEKLETRKLSSVNLSSL